MRLGCRLVMWLVAMAMLAPAAQAQTTDPVAAAIGRRVAAVSLTLEGQPYSNPRLDALIEVKVGEPLQPDRVRETLAHLFSLGTFDDVVVQTTADGADVRVVFALTPVHPVDRLEFRGAESLDVRALERVVLDAAGGRVSAVRADTTRDAVLRELRDEGFRNPTVTVSADQTHVVHRSTLVVHITAGPRLRIGRVQVVGGDQATATDVASRAGVQTGAPYRRRAIEDALRGEAERLRARRYYEASVSHTVRPVDDATVDVEIVITPGPIVDIVVEGDPLPPGGRLDDWIPIRRENSADDDLLEDAAFRMQQAWQREGYWRATVVPIKNNTDQGRMVVTFTISRGPQHRLAGVTMEGQSHFDVRDIRALIGLREGEPFVESAVDARLGALTAAYAIAGFDAEVVYRATARPTAPGSPVADVDLHLTINEGPLRLVGEVDVRGVSDEHLAGVRRVIRSQPGQPLRSAQVRDDRLAIQQLYLDLGFQSAVVTSRVAAEAPFAITFDVIEGGRTVVDHVIVVGNRRVTTDTILAEVTLQSGMPFGQAARLESQRRLAELATFRRITITQAAEGRREGHVDVVVHVEEAPASTIGYGGGVEFGRRVRSAEGGGTEDALWFAPRGFLELGRRNLFGSNRSATLFTRASLGSRNTPDDALTDGRGFTLSEYRVTGTYRSPRALGGRLDATLSATAERAIRTSFTFVRRAMHAELVRRATPRTSVFGRYALESTELYDARISAEDQPLIDRLFPQVRLSSFSTGVVWDRRNDVIEPTDGTLLSVDGELAARAFGSEVGFVKAFSQAVGFLPLGNGSRVVLAGRAQVGLARGFAREVLVLDDLGLPAVDPTTGVTRREVVRDVPAGRRYFAGGSTSVRGFQQDRLGVPEVLNEDGLSNGGNGLIVLNGEVRTQLGRGLGMVGFVDGGNVFSRVGDMAPGKLRAAAGLGLRYRSPLGPLRFDVGFKFSRRVIAGARERGWEFHLSIGEVF